MKARTVDDVKAIRYTEVLKLRKYCEKIGVDVVLDTIHDGYRIRFNNGADFVQHQYSYGGVDGYVKPAGISKKLDCSAITLEQAKTLVRNHKEKLNKKRNEV